MDFLNDLKNIVANELTRLGIPFDPAADVQALLLLACNHELKNIKQAKRKVHTSAEFDAELLKLPPDQQAAAKAIQQKFVQADDVNGHLSKGSDPKRADEVDQLLADWGIYHLHISNHKQNPTDTFFARTGPVMFAHVTSTDVYFIDIYPHGGWTRQKLLEIVERSWPKLYQGSRLPGVTAVTFNPSDTGIKQLRKGNVNPILQVGSSFVSGPGGGFATDGTPIANVMRMFRTLRLVKQIEKWAKQNSDKLKAEVSERTGVPASELDFELVPLTPTAFGIREKKTKTMVYESTEKSANPPKSGKP